MNFEFSSVMEKIEDFLKTYLFTINQTKVTVSSILWFLLVIVGFWILSKFIRKWILSKVLEHLKVEMGLRFAFSRIAHYLIMVTGTVVAFQFIGLNLSGLAVVFGFLSVGIGFGLQNITSNFVSGLILLFERPIKIGDRVSAIHHDSIPEEHHHYRAELGVYFLPGGELVARRPQSPAGCARRGFL
jgi:small-conductance mechanosensitive channel